jgi:1-acyl-sn-glycerol-3-phosphate acyltransferase
MLAQRLATGSSWCFSRSSLESEIDPPLPPLPSPVAYLRGVVRGILMMAAVAIALLDYWINVRKDVHTKRKSQAEWLHRSCLRIARLLSVRVDRHGKLPFQGLVVSNHLSYLDIIMLAAAGSFVFVSKSEVAEWPIFGLCARLAGTVFIDRTRRGEVAPVADEMREVLNSGVPLVLFAEGTSTGGDSVLPFKPALFAPVADSGIPVTPCAISYAMQEGSVADEICYWGDDVFVPHLIHFLGKLGVSVRIHFGKSHPPSADRKEIARTLHAEVLELYRASELEPS